MQETHSTKENKIRRNVAFISQIHYFHDKSNSCSVLIVFFGSTSYKASDKHGRTLIIEALINHTEYLLMNLYNANTKNDHLTNISELTNLFENFDLTKKKAIIVAGDFHLFLYRSLATKGRNLCLKKRSLSKILNISEK